MQTIVVLPEDVISQIAAGEVIERPAFVIKELIDNSIDAGATKITIDLKGTIFDYITVQDNGGGISTEDILLASKLHATSKIRVSDDLSTVQTLGFRGEALASIQAMSTLTISSRQEENSLGVVYSSADDTVQSVGMPKGTRVTVERLFADVPARKSFLKSAQSERRFILDVVTSYAFAYPNIHFTLRHNGKILLDRTQETLLERYLSQYDQLPSSELLPIQFEDSYLSLNGYIGKPNRSFRSTREQYFIVNHRPIRDRLLSSALKEAYGTLLPKDSFPSGIIHLQIPVQLIDVNVHPRKEEISFSNPNHIYLAVQNAVRETLQEHNLTFESSGWKLFSHSHSSNNSSITASKAGKTLKDLVLSKPTTKEEFDWKTLVQWHHTYMSVQTKNGVFFFDQHAVHERILFETFSKSFAQQRNVPTTVGFASPIILHVSTSDKLLIDEYIPLFDTLGFKISHSAQNVYMVESAPALFSDRNPAQIIEECIADLRNGEPLRSIDTLSHKLLTYLACRSAVKAGDVLRKEQMKKLILDLQKVPNKFTCPHGRPTMIEVHKKDFDSLFKRL